MTLEKQFDTLMDDILDVQSDLFAAISEKRKALIETDIDAITALIAREETLAGKLNECSERREVLLKIAKKVGVKAASVRAVVSSLPSKNRASLEAKIGKIERQAKMLKSQNLTNLLVIQKTLLHLSKMVEIIATGSPEKTIYSNGQSGSTSDCSGKLVDHAI